MTKIGTVSLSGRVKLLVSLIGKNVDELTQALTLLNKANVDIIEWRIDSLQNLSEDTVMSALRFVRKKTKKPLLATLRTHFEGGWATVSATKYVNLLKKIITSGLVDAVDIEIDRPGAISLFELTKSSQVTSVSSFHNFEKTPRKRFILAKLAKMNQAHADVLKIALMPQTVADVITLAEACKEAKHSFTQPMIAISMGSLGSITRIAAKAIGSAATFASLSSGSAPGQLNIKETAYFLNLLDNHHL